MSTHLSDRGWTFSQAFPGVRHSIYIPLNSHSKYSRTPTQHFYLENQLMKPSIKFGY